ncbi:MAG: hypothetical protein SXA11_06205 [Cyanobacteriota bacterium]|nr:hypothetical protein [Cyanobacteriota bacterium]
MSATTTISTKEIKQIFQQRTSDPSELWRLAEKANTLAVVVENYWENLPPKKQELLTAFAYIDFEQPKGINRILLDSIKTLFAAWIVAWIVIKGELNAFITYRNALERLVNAILSAIERENLAYQKALSKAIENAIISSENNKAMTAEEACERLRELSNQALE